ncbi:zinc ribbon domain-containing protein [Thalassobacillus devorans]|uniref:zinc ribbon domain-containing protein n=1 Tax=Thalassobacillus devorans TaxID=279813 RepID=UPI000A1CCB60|nr:zinc ribbon domain-containing protein [Thalassobacillus devorans]
MQQCANCNAEYQGGKFCGNCGKPFKAPATGVSQPHNTMTSQDSESLPVSDSTAPEYHPAVTQQQAQPAAGPPATADPDTFQGSSGNFVQSTKEYLEYLKVVCKEPTSAFQEGIDDNFAKAKNTLFLFLILAGLTVYLATKSVTDLFDLFGFGFDVPFMAVFFPVLITALIGVIAVSVTMFLLIKIGKPQTPSFKEVSGRFVTFLTIPTILLAITCLFLLLDLISLVPFLNALTLFGLAAAIPFTLYSLHNDKKLGLDPFIHTLLTYLILFILMRVAVDHIVTSMTEMFMPF